MRPLRAAAILLPCALMLGAAFAAEAPPLTLEPYEFVAEDGTKVSAQFGQLRVRENRSEPGSRTIVLSFVRFPATAAKPGPPIVYLAGGPGGSGISAARGTRFPLFMALREHGDVIAFNQRGLHATDDSDVPETACDEEYVVDPAPLDRARAGAAAAAAARRCVAKLVQKGVDLSGYTTVESAADLDDLRRALGAEKLTLWGISYGTHLALATLKAHGDRIDRVILAGIEGLDETYKLPSDQQDLLSAIAALAKPLVPDLLGSLRALLRELEARPKTVTLTDPRDGAVVPLAMGPLDLQLVIAQMLTGPDSFNVLPDLVARLEQGDWTALALAAARLRLGEVPSGMTMAMDCASGLTAERKRRIATEAKEMLLGDAINLPFPEICAAVPVADLGDAYRAPVASRVPALLISGTLDGRTRPRQAEGLLPGMSNAVHLVIEGAGHSDPLFLSSPKILETMHRFLRGEPIVERRIVLPPPTFLPVRKVVTLPDETLARFVGSYRIGGDAVRRVVKAGSVLYTVREGGQPFAIRPSSATEFFYEGAASTIRFETDDEGKVTAMLFRGADGSEQRCPRM